MRIDVRFRERFIQPNTRRLDLTESVNTYLCCQILLHA